MGNRSIVYIDGFNFYYGAVKGSPWKWLDLEAYFRRIRQGDDIQEISYFTSRVVYDREAWKRQDAYLSALATLPLLKVYEGRYRKKKYDCNIDCLYVGNQKVVTYEEKQTDVAIAVKMLDDAYQDRCDRFILVTGDSDLVPAVRTVRARFPDKVVHVYVPANDPDRGAAKELRDVASQHHTIQANLFKVCQLASPVRTPRGPVAKPAEWETVATV